MNTDLFQKIKFIKRKDRRLKNEKDKKKKEALRFFPLGVTLTHYATVYRFIKKIENVIQSEK